ncbi:hypothetical protein ACR77J_15820 [Tissierella praeacuta]|uniref:hypothetical protein n=1 Tax=Tissierella praeacuta TaxID=43131 RepID=UPI002FD9ADA1
MATKATEVEREPFEYFDIAFLGYNAKLTNYGFRQFLENNREQIRAVYFESLIIILKDGTRLKAIPIVDVRHLGGYRFDQLILFDDERWLIEWKRSEDIRIIKALTMQLSNVPEEFQILKYEDIR